MEIFSHTLKVIAHATARFNNEQETGESFCGTGPFLILLAISSHRALISGISEELAEYYLMTILCSSLSLFHSSFISPHVW
jgi:hypothetical protein